MNAAAVLLPLKHAARAAAMACVLSSCAAQARAADDPSSEKGRIAAERAAVEAGFKARDQACRQRFVVASCVEEAKRDRRAALDALRSRRSVIDEAERRKRVAARRAEIAAKSADDAKRDRERTAGVASASSAAAAGSAASAAEGGAKKSRIGGALRDRPASAPRAPSLARDRPGTGPPEPKARNAESPAELQEREAKSRAAFEERQRQAAAHRAEVAEKNAERDRKRPPAAGLPVPGASSAASVVRTGPDV